MTRYTLSYTYKDGSKQTLYNLLQSAVDEITRVQTGFGSHSFKAEAQLGHYCQFEIDLLRGKN